MRVLARIISMSLLCMAATAMPALAAFPGENGRIAYVVGLGGVHDIHSANPDGTGIQALTSGPEIDQAPAWSPDGTQIAFERRLDWDHAPDIYVMNADGSDERQVTSSPAADDDPTWSPDGRIAYSHRDPNGWQPGVARNRIAVIIPDGSGQQVLSPRSFWNTYDPTWSADVNTIVFEFVHSCNFACELNRDLYKVNHDGTGFGPVTSSGLDEWHADFSPDSTKLGFSTDRGSAGYEVFGWEVYVMGADGSSPVNLTNTSEITEWEPAWSPDGQRLVYSSFTAIDGELYTVRPDGTGRVDTTINGSQPSWQPVLNEAPDCSSATASPGLLRPANSHFRTVMLTGVTDPDGDPVSLAIEGVTQDEPVGRRPDALRAVRLDRVKLRAKRDNSGDGRVYRIAFTASDGQGGECSGEANVEVRRKKHRPAIDSAPPSFDSFASRRGGA